MFTDSFNDIYVIYMVNTLINEIKGVIYACIKCLIKHLSNRGGVAGGGGGEESVGKRMGFDKFEKF